MRMFCAFVIRFCVILLCVHLLSSYVRLLHVFIMSSSKCIVRCSVDCTVCCVCVDCREVARLTGDLLPIVSVYVFFDGIAVSISPVTAIDKKA